MVGASRLELLFQGALPKVADAVISLGNEYIQQLNQATQHRDARQFQKAALLLRSARQHSPNVVETARSMIMEASCLTLMGDFRQARKLLAEAERLAPADDSLKLGIEHETARIERAECNPTLALKRTLQILRDFRELLKKPEYTEWVSELEVERAMLLVETGQAEWAVPFLLACHSSHPDRADISYYLGKAYFGVAQFDKALRVFKEALQHRDPDSTLNSRLKYMLAYTHYNLGAYAQAVSVLQELEGEEFGAEVPRTSFYGMLAASFQRLGMNDEAIRYKNLAESGDL